MNNLIKDRIQKQLLNFDQDIEFDKSNSVQKNIDRSIDKEKWILENTVDLGLPSGTLWMKNNLGASCGNTVESWVGNYYAWGELKPKIEFTKDNYTYEKEITILSINHDVAFQTTNGICHMPTKEQLEELINETSSQWIENYNKIKYLNGRVFTGPNGNTLFIPAAGFYDCISIYNYGTYCYLWSSTVNQYNIRNAYIISINSSDIQIYGDDRYDGHSVRGVL